jgi:predicted DNA-binding transcriptional regulator AlpA
MNWHPDQLLTSKDIRQAGGPPERTLERWRATGDGPRYVRIGPKIVRYRAADYLAWLEANTFAHAAEEHARRAADATPQT